MESLLFGNRFYYLRIGFLLAAVFSMFVYSSRAGEKINPDFRICRLDPPKYHGTDLWVPHAVVDVAEPHGLWIKAGYSRIFVKTDSKGWSRGDNVTVRGIFQNDGGTGSIHARALEKMVGIGWKNKLILGVSVLMLVFVLWRCSRVFTFDRSGITLTER